VNAGPAQNPSSNRSALVPEICVANSQSDDSSVHVVHRMPSVSDQTHPRLQSGLASNHIGVWIFRLSESGKRKVESGKWKVESGKWKVESGKWKVESGKWKVESGLATDAHGKHGNVIGRVGG
jgi:hypothetical protein